MREKSTPGRTLIKSNKTNVTCVPFGHFKLAFCNGIAFVRIFSLFTRGTLFRLKESEVEKSNYFMVTIGIKKEFPNLWKGNL